MAGNLPAWEMNHFYLHAAQNTFTLLYLLAGSFITHPLKVVEIKLALVKGKEILHTFYYSLFRIVDLAKCIVACKLLHCRVAIKLFGEYHFFTV